MYVYRRNGGSISRNYIAGLLWDIVIDVAQYFYTSPNANEFATNDNHPQTIFYFRESLVSENIYAHPMETHVKCLNNYSQSKPGIVGTKPNNDIDKPCTPREGKGPRDKGNQLSRNKQDS